MSNANFSSGSTFRSVHDDFYFYDRLPPSARLALQGAAFDWSSGALYRRFTKAVKGYRTGKECAARVAEWDKAQIKRDARKVWGRP